MYTGGTDALETSNGGIIEEILAIGKKIGRS